MRLRASKLCWALVRPEPRRALVRHRVLASSEHQRAPMRSSYGTVLDVGSHRGQFAVFAAHRFPGASIHCFEPQPAPRARLARVAASLSSEIMVSPYAAAETSGRVAMHVSARDDSSSLLPIAPDGQAKTFPGTNAVGMIEVELRPLDELLQAVTLVRPVLLKIDVQGSELDALRGAPRTLERVDDVLVEGSFRELYTGQPLVSAVLGELFTRGYELLDIDVSVEDRMGPVQADMFLRRSRRPSDE